MSSFDPNDFLYVESEQELDTRFIPVPQGDYTAQCTGVKAFSGETDKTDSGMWVRFEFTWQIDDPEVAEITKRPKNNVRQSVFVDLTPEGKLDFGPQKNIGLGRIYDACGLPTKGTSPAQVEGQMAKVRVKNVPMQGSEDLRAEVSSVMKV